MNTSHRILLVSCLALVSLGPLSPSIVHADCRWTDGQDARVAGDPGRGVTDWRQHFAAGQASPANVPEWVGSRFDALRGCMSADNFARLYADASLRLARAGASVGWVNGSDPQAGTDSGRGIRTFRPHYDHARDATRAAGVSAFIRQRLTDLRGRLGAEDYARLYADLSILVVHYAAMD